MSLKDIALHIQIETSKSDESTEDEIIKWLKQAKSILKDVKEKWDEELIIKFKKEHEDLKQSIRKSLKDDRKITTAELEGIRLELENITELAKDEGIIESTNNITNYIPNFLLEDKPKELYNKSIKEYNTEEAISALNYINTNYLEIINKVLSIWDETIETLDSISEANTFQEKLIQKILWNNKWYNNKYIAWYNNKKWNYLVKISEFKKNIKIKEISWNIEPENTINSMELANYFLYLKDKWNWIIQPDILLDDLWIKNIRQLLSLWQKEDSSITRDIIWEENLESIQESINNLSKQKVLNFEEIKKTLLKENIKDKDIQFFIDYPENISFIEEKVKFLEVYKALKNKWFENVKGEYTYLSLINVNKALSEDIDILKTINITALEFQLITNDFFTVENSIELLNNNKNLIYYIFPKIINNLDNERVRKVFNESELNESDIRNLPQNIQNILMNNEKDNKTKEEYENDINKDKSWKEISTLLNQYIYIYWITEEIKDKLISVLKYWEIPSSIITVWIKDIEIASIYLSKKWASLADIQILSDDIRSDSKIIELLISNSSYEQIEKYFEHINITSVNRLLFLFRTVKEKFQGDKEVMQQMWNSFLSSKLRAKVLEVFINSKDDIILVKYKEEFEQIVGMMKEITSFHNVMEKWRGHVKEHKHNHNEKHKEHKHEHNEEIPVLQKIREILRKEWLERFTETFIEWELTDDSILFKELINKQFTKEEAISFIKELLEHKEHLLEEEEESTNIKITEEQKKDFDDKSKDFLKEWKINKEKLKEDYDIFKEKYIEEKLKEDETVVIDEEKIIEEYLKKFDNIEDKKLKEEFKWVIEQLIEIHVKRQETKIKIESIESKDWIYTKALETWKEEDINAMKKLYQEELKTSNKERKEYKIRNDNSTLRTKVLDRSEYERTWNWYSFISNWEEIKITLEEKNLIDKYPDIKEQIVNTKNLLEDLNMWMIWNFRRQIFAVTSWTGFNLNDWNYLNQNEIKLFLSKIIKSIEPELNEVWNQELPTTSLTLNEYIESVKRLNKISPIWWMKEVNMLWESYLENLFIEKFSDRYSSVSHFDALNFRDSLNNSKINK